MKNLLNILAQFLQDENGRYSSARLLMIGGVGLVLAVWGFLSISKNTLFDIPLGVQTVIGILIAGKVTQKFMEKNDEPPKVD